MAISQFPPEASHLTRKNSKAMPNTTYGMIPTFGDSAVIKSFTGAFLKSRSIQSSTSSTQHLEAATMDQLGLLGKCLIAGSISPPFLEMLISLSPPATNVRKPEWPRTKSIKCPSNPSCFVKSLMFGKPLPPRPVVVDFLKSNIVCRFGVPKVLISDQGSHFCNRTMASLLQKYGVTHKISTAYHPKQMAKLKFLTEKLRKHCKRCPTQARKTGADSLRTLFGHIELHTEHR
ncbi:hypothetical protein CR513_01135, partial [Mucuna pruriens]